ncbi:MAG: TonB family protein [Acidobacteria bacterium]|nr:TonB family protein [Acidobacteriota bacterium]
MKIKPQLCIQILLLTIFGLAWFQIAAGQEVSNAEKAFQEGRVYFARRNYDAAIEAFKKAITQNGKYAEAHYYLGLAYTRKSLWSQAVPAFQQAIDSREGNVYPEALLGLAGCSYFQRDFAAAIAQCQKAIEQRGASTPFASAYNLLGLAHLQRTEYGPAADAFRQATQQQTPYPDALCSLGDSLWLQSSRASADSPTGLMIDRAWDEQKVKEAIAAYQKAIEQQATFARAHRQLGIALIGVNPEQARQELGAFVQSDPNSRDVPWVQQAIKDLKQLSEFHRCDEPGMEEIKLVNPPTLELPDKVKAGQIEGAVELGAVFGADGKVRAVHVIKGLAAEVDDKAIDIVRNLKFEPMMKNGQPVSVLNTVRITYKSK